MNILILGTGYVGLVSAACLANLGHTVLGIDNDNNKIEKLNQGISPFFEPGLDELIQTNLNKTLLFSNDLSNNINKADVIFLAVGTPPKANGQADLSHIFLAAEEIGKHLNRDILIATKSTVPVGTNRKIKKIIEKYYTGEFSVASCPEFLREGSAINDFISPDRLVFGVENENSKYILEQVFQAINCTKLITNLETAEMIKYAANAFLATKISFVNEIANVCEQVGADIEVVTKGMGLDRRIGPQFLKAGLGYGGSCFPKDVRALHHIAGENGYHFQLLKSVIEVNNQQRWHFYQKIKQTLSDLNGKKIAIWGTAFKPNTDDIRESIAIDLIEKFLDDGATISVFDPQATENTKKILGDRVTYALTPESTTSQADAVILITEWPEFLDIDFNQIQKQMITPNIFDGRNLLNPKQMQEYGFNYYSIGR